MFKPISFQVIRQVMAWEGLAPASIRCLSSFEAPDHVQFAEYLMTFTREQLAEWLPGRDLRNQEPGWYELRHWLRDCFCPDVQVMGQTYNEASGGMYVNLSIVVHPDATQLPLTGLGDLDWLVDGNTAVKE